MQKIYAPNRRIVEQVLLATVNFGVSIRKRNSNPPVYESPIINMFHNADMGLLAEDKRGLINVANLLAAEMFGYEMIEFVSTPSENLVPERFRQAREKLFRRILEERIVVELDGLRMDKAGKEVPIHAWVFPYKLGKEYSIAAAIRKRYIS